MKHFYAGLFITLIVGLIVGSDGSTFNNLSNGIWIGFTVGAIIGLLKELVYDLALGKGHAETKDFLATCIGSAVGSMVLGLIYIIIK
jgi:hypothetical protein